MPRLVSFVAAEGVAIDQLTSRVTAFNMIDHVLLPAVPARLVRLSALSLYELTEKVESFAERIRLVTPTGAVAAVSESVVLLPLRNPGELPNGHRSLHVLWSPHLDVIGDYRLILDHRPEAGEWQELASICITALVQAHPILNAQTPSVSLPSAPAPAPPSQPQ
jgi:hypothetical protein